MTVPNSDLNRDAYPAQGDLYLPAPPPAPIPPAPLDVHSSPKAPPPIPAPPGTAPTRWSKPIESDGPPGELKPTSAARPVKDIPGNPSTSTDEKESDEEEGLTKLAARNATPWLISSVFHMVLIILLGLWFLPIDLPSLVNLEVLSPDTLNTFGPESEIAGVQLEDPSITEERPLEHDVFNPQALNEVDDPFAAPPALQTVPGGLMATSPITTSGIGLALQGREEGSKQALLGKYGGTPATEGAVGNGLTWLTKYQRNDGSWSLKGPYSDGSQFDNSVAATAMALLAYQGAGNTHQKGRYKHQVERGMNYLLRQIDEHGNFFHTGPLHSGLYSQAQCTIAICELYGMTKDSRLREPAQLAVNYCVSAQDKNKGGWRYIPGEDSDTSVTGWFLMALQSAKMAGLEVPSPTLSLISQFLETVSYEGGSRYGYIAGGEPKRSMTAEGLLCREWLGWPREDERLQKGADWLLSKENLPAWSERDVYYWYYATQVLHHLEGDRWETWNHLMRELLPERQEKKGAEAGSWHPTGPQADQWGFHGGRLYVTCLSIYILEVYYRHLPIYSSGLSTEVATAPLPAP